MLCNTGKVQRKFCAYEEAELRSGKSIPLLSNFSSIITIEHEYPGVRQLWSPCCCPHHSFGLVCGFMTSYGHKPPSRYLRA